MRALCLTITLVGEVGSSGFFAMASRDDWHRVGSTDLDEGCRMICDHAKMWKMFTDLARYYVLVVVFFSSSSSSSSPSSLEDSDPVLLLCARCAVVGRCSSRGLQTIHWIVSKIAADLTRGYQD